METSTDDLLRACADHQSMAWDLLVSRYARLVYSIPARHGLPQADRDDIFQAVFSSLFSNIGQIRDGRALPKWLITTAHRATWRHLRKHRAEQDVLGTTPHAQDSGELPQDQLARLEQQQLVHEGLEALGGRCEQLLKALFLERPALSYLQVASRLSIPMDSIGPTRLRCMAKLVTRLAEMGRIHEFRDLGAPNESERAARMNRTREE